VVLVVVTLSAVILACNFPDIVCLTIQNRKFIEVSCPADVNVPSKENESNTKAHDFRLMYNMTVELVPLVLDVLVLYLRTVTPIYIIS